MNDWTLDKWVDEIWRLYGHHDRNRSVSDMWSSLGIYVSHIAEGLRKATYHEVFSGLSHTFVWLAGFVAKCKYDEELPEIYRIDESFSDIVALKYPFACSHCYATPCNCSSQRSLLEALKNKSIGESELRMRREDFRQWAIYPEWTTDQWVGMFKRVFENSYMPLPVETIGFHLAEEVGEVAAAIRELTHLEGPEPEIKNKEERVEEARLELKIELADCVSWIAAVFLRSRAVVESAGGDQGYFAITDVPRFSTILQKRFAPDGKLGCPKCSYANPCACPLAIVKYFPASQSRAEAPAETRP